MFQVNIFFKKVLPVTVLMKLATVNDHSLFFIMAHFKCLQRYLTLKEQYFLQLNAISLNFCY